MAGLVRRRGFLGGLAGAGLMRALPARAVPAGALAAPADLVLVLKADRLLHLLRDGAGIVATYPVALGRQPVGPKRRLGDQRTPEGRYRIDGRNAESRFHLALHISYPDAADRERAAAAGADPGGDICLHGLPPGYEALDPPAFVRDWTDGCIAVSDRAIEEIWDRVEDGTPIVIRP